MLELVLFRTHAGTVSAKGISTGDFAEALAALLGPDAGGLSASTVARLTEVWADEHAHWLKRDLSASNIRRWRLALSTNLTSIGGGIRRISLRSLSAETVKARMMREVFDAEDWIDRLATSLPRLAKAQEPYLEHYWRHHPRTHRIVDGRDVTPFPLDDVRMVYTRVPVVSQLLGHKNVRMTLRYAHLGDREIEAAAERVGRSIATIMDLWPVTTRHRSVLP